MSLGTSRHANTYISDDLQQSQSYRDFQYQEDEGMTYPGTSG